MLLEMASLTESNVFTVIPKNVNIIILHKYCIQSSLCLQLSSQPLEYHFQVYSSSLSGVTLSETFYLSDLLI